MVSGWVIVSTSKTGSGTVSAINTGSNIVSGIESIKIGKVSAAAYCYVGKVSVTNSWTSGST